jgi:hypothetical protein
MRLTTLATIAHRDFSLHDSARAIREVRATIRDVRTKKCGGAFGRAAIRRCVASRRDVWLHFRITRAQLQI